MSGLELNKVCKSYGSVEVIKDLSLSVESGEFVVFVGPSGCGKSTLLRMIAGLEECSGGQIDIDGEDVTDAEPSDRGIAMVFQSYALYPHMSVRDNIGFGLSLAKTPKAEMNARVEEAARILQLTDYLDRKPKALSGGQRQRVAIGRAIVRDPKVFLFDEPLSNLDAALRAKMRLELTDLHASLSATMIYVTHDQVEAMTMADKIVVLNNGVIEQVGKPMDLYNNPATAFVAGFIGSPQMNLLEGPAAQKMNAEIYGIRPEHIDISRKSGMWQATVRQIERLGNDATLYLDVVDVGPLTVTTDGQTDVIIGDKIFATPQLNNEHRFPAANAWLTVTLAYGPIPNNVSEIALAFYEVLRAGGFKTGGPNFDAKRRRQTLVSEGLILANVSDMDTCDVSLDAAAVNLSTHPACKRPQRPDEGRDSNMRVNALKKAITTEFSPPGSLATKLLPLYSARYFWIVHYVEFNQMYRMRPMV